jgi:UDP-glucose 4-epimerase
MRTVSQRFFIVGGAGFIGSHFYDNFSSGREWHFAPHAGDARLRVVRGEAEDTGALAAAMAGHDVVIHLASNPDIARAAREPTIDFWQGTALTQSVLEAMRTSGATRILYASGSGVYGDLGAHEAAEDHGPLVPVSTYGASKLAGETHGVGFDFARALLRAIAAGEKDISLRVLGDGSQSKSYIHVDDVVRAVLTAHAATTAPFAVYNVATGDYITVREIAELAVACVGLAPGSVRFAYTGGDRGWKGDVPVVRLDTRRIRALGWRCERPSREALRASIAAMIPEMQAGRM